MKQHYILVWIGNPPPVSDRNSNIRWSELADRLTKEIQSAIPGTEPTGRGGWLIPLGNDLPVAVVDMLQQVKDAEFKCKTLFVESQTES